VTSTNGASPTKRRTKADIQDLRNAMFEMVEQAAPMTVRQVFYRGVGFGLWDKTEGDYKNVVCRLLASMRRDHDMPFDWIADGTRWQRKPTTHSSMEAALEATARTYRRALWDQGNWYVEVWLEKEALAGVLVDITAKWDVPLMVTRGYPSLSYLHNAGVAISQRFTLYGQATSIFYLGDRDPSGDDIARKVEEDLRDFAGEEAGRLLEFTRLAVTEEQVGIFNLPTRPTKKSDSRSRNWDGSASVEVDAIDPNQLRGMVDAVIEHFIDPHQLEVLQAVEAEERRTLTELIRETGR